MLKKAQTGKNSQLTESQQFSLIKPYTFGRGAESRAAARRTQHGCPSAVPPGWGARVFLCHNHTALLQAFC